jgi:hypothetical protein
LPPNGEQAPPPVAVPAMRPPQPRTCTPRPLRFVFELAFCLRTHLLALRLYLLLVLLLGWPQTLPETESLPRRTERYGIPVSTPPHLPLATHYTHPTPRVNNAGACTVPHTCTHTMLHTNYPFYSSLENTRQRWFEMKNIRVGLPSERITSRST